MSNELHEIMRKMGLQIPMVDKDYNLIGFVDEYEYYKKLSGALGEEIADKMTPTAINAEGMRNYLYLKGRAVAAVHETGLTEVKEVGAFIEGFIEGAEALQKDYESKYAWLREALKVASINMNHNKP